ncbi:MAG: hypothetical protein DRP13_04195, partial [Candidatus Aenigmatarchaeota archaeon]
WVSYNPSSISSLQAGSNQTITVRVSIPAGTSPGNYSCKINATSENDGSDWLWLNITVPLDDSWAREPESCQRSVQANQTGVLCTVTVQNTGNVPLNFNVTPTSLTNYTYPSVTSFSIAAQGSYPFNINYNTSGATVGEQKITTYNISSNSSSLSYQLTTASIKIVTIPWWNSSWIYRKPIYLNEIFGIERVNWPVEVNVSVDGHINNCTKEIRAISIESGGNVEIPSQVISGDGSTWCYIVFLANISANANNERRYYVYYGNPSASVPSYADSMSNTITSTDWTFNNGKISWHYDLDGTYGDGTGSAMAWITTPNGVNMSTDPSYAADDWETSADGSATVTTEINGPIYKKIELTDGASRTEYFYIYAKQNWFKVIYMVAPDALTYELNLPSLDDSGTSTADAYYDDTGPVTSETSYTASRYFWCEYNTGAQGFGMVVGPANQPFEGNTLTFYDSSTGYEWYSNDVTGQDFFPGYPFWFFTNDDGINGANETANKIKNPPNVSIGSEEKLILPNITSITIYNVTNLTDKHSGGTLVKSSLNDTFNLFKDYDYHSTGVYRIEINVTGDSSWNLSVSTIVYHEGLDPNWIIEDIWYSNGTENFTGGTFSNGKITWDTSLGGYNPNGEFTFYYILNITGGTQQRQVHFYVNETDWTKADGLSWDEDYSVYNITAIGYLEVNLIMPPSIPGNGDAEQGTGYIVGQNKTFILKANLTCREGLCGKVNATVRYNSSGTEPDTPISTSYDTPFYIMNSSAGFAQNPISCGTLNENESCILNWTINSTGALHTLWKMDVLFTSTLSESNQTNTTSIYIGIILIVNVGFQDIYFGIVNPDNEFYLYPAYNNSDDYYNVTVHSNSNDVEGLWIKGTDLTNGTPSYNTMINVSHAKWSLTNLGDHPGPPQPANMYNLSYEYDRINKDIQVIPAGTNETLYFWIDAPKGVYPRLYTGTVWIMANSTD